MTRLFSDSLLSCRHVAGDGTTCTPTPLIAQLPSLYTDVADQGPLVCDIPYPMNAPGFNYDPTGALQDDVFSTGKQVRLFPPGGMVQDAVQSPPVPRRPLISRATFKQVRLSPPGGMVQEAVQSGPVPHISHATGNHKQVRLYVLEGWYHPTRAYRLR